MVGIESFERLLIKIAFIDQFSVKRTHGKCSEGQELSVEGILEEDPEPNEDGIAFVTLTTSDNNRVAIVLTGEDLNYKAGDVVNVSGEIAGVNTTKDGVDVPLIDGITISRKE